MRESPLMWFCSTTDTDQDKPWRTKVKLELVGEDGSVKGADEIQPDIKVAPSGSGDGPPAVTVNVPINAYRVYIYDQFPRRLTNWNTEDIEKAWKEANKELRKLVTTFAVHRQLEYDRVEVHWGNTKPSPGPTELFCRLCRWEGSWLGADAKDETRDPATGGGATHVRQGGKLVCEVWPERLQTNTSIDGMGRMLARLIMHEMMHSIMGLDYELHDLSPDGSIGCPPVDKNSDLPDSHKALLAQKLLESRTYFNL